MGDCEQDILLDFGDKEFKLQFGIAGLTNEKTL